MTPLKKILYIDMDNTLVDFQSGIDALSAKDLETYLEHYDDAPGIFALMRPLDGAVDAFLELSQLFDTYILSTAPWDNPSAWSDKLLWVKKHLGATPDSPAYKRLILSHHKNLNNGDFIVDDRDARGVKDFNGTHIHFGKPGFETWGDVVAHLRPLA
ncbi:5' nucleotidase, NT5C type [Gordonia sp. NPDC003425]